MNETEALLVLNAVKGLGNAGIRKLLNHYGSAQAVLSMKSADLIGHSILPESTVENICAFQRTKFLDNEYRLMNKQGVSVITHEDDAYPKNLHEIADAPLVLYVKGNLSLGDPLTIALVGSRKATLYGMKVAEQFASRLAEMDFVIVSGLARGIDAAAHNGALLAHGSTVAVLGCGLSIAYPPENKSLCDAIAENGAVLSEFPMQTAPVPYNFPRRNRIISGLSLGVIVVEAAERSGALLTADFALDQGREVYAVPGRIDQDSSRGTNKLIKQGAKLVTCVEDVLEDLKGNIESSISTSGYVVNPLLPHNRIEELTHDEKLVFDQVSDRPIHIDELSNRCGQKVPVMTVLLQLELKQLIKQLPGKLFVR